MSQKETSEGQDMGAYEEEAVDMDVAESDASASNEKGTPEEKKKKRGGTRETIKWMMDAVDTARKSGDDDVDEGKAIADSLKKKQEEEAEAARKEADAEAARQEAEAEAARKQEEAEAADEQEEEATASHELDEEASAEFSTAPIGADSSNEEIEQLRGELADVRDKLMRQVAGFQNYRRRTEQEKIKLTTMLKGDIVKHLLDVVDDFERTFDAVEGVENSDETDYEEAYHSVKEGVELVYRKLMDEIKRLGVEPIEAEGQPFNEEEHDAMMQQPPPDDDTPEGTVLQEIQRGYRLGDRVLRHSKVIVAGQG